MSEAELLETVPQAVTVGYDERGNRRARLTVGTTSLTVVVDEAQGMIITLWVE